MKRTSIVHALVAVAVGFAGASQAADIVFTPPASGGVAITNAAGNVIRLRVAEDGAFTLPGLASVPLPSIGLCAEIATGKVGTCSVGVFTSLTAGTGLTGGTITTSGTVALAPGFQLPQACTNGQVPASNGAGAWSCVSPVSASGGTVTSVAVGTGLTGGPITASGTIAIASGGVGTTQLADGAVTAAKLAASGCTNGQILKYNGSAWACAADNAAAAGAFAQGGSSFGATAIIGTNDAFGVELIANGARAMRYERIGNGVNVLGGASVNGITSGVYAAAIAGGGITGTNDPGTGESCGASGCANTVTDHGGTVGGGVANRAGDGGGTAGNSPYATVSGGFGNQASGPYSVVGGGTGNMAIGPRNTIGGGVNNGSIGNVSTIGGGINIALASNYGTVSGGGNNSAMGGDNATVGGGFGNAASGTNSTVGGGQSNLASGDGGAVGGGSNNTASGSPSTVPGGRFNTAAGDSSFAAGYRAKANAAGCFVWADNAEADFACSQGNEFSARATGGVRFVTATDFSGVPTHTFQLLSDRLVLPVDGAIYRGGVRFAHTFGLANTFFGQYAGSLLFNTAANNVGVGEQALYALTEGFENTSLGSLALTQNTTGAGNTAVGYRALIANTSAFNSTAVGAQALNNSTAAGNIALGAFAGYNLTTGGGNIAIGNGAVAAEADTIRIGGGQSRAFIAGIRGIQTGVNNAIAVFIDGNGQLGTASSSRRVKDDIADMGEASEALMQLRPVTFRYKSHVATGQASRQYGLIAEEVAEVAPELVAHAADGSIETVNYQFLAPMLVNEIQKQRQEIEALRAELASIKQALGLR